MSAFERRKGRDGQAAAKRLLRDRDWSVSGTELGTAIEDIIGIDPDEKVWAIEVKDTKDIALSHREKVMHGARKRRAAWMMMNHIHGTSSWLIQRQGKKPIVWHEKTEEKSDEES